MAPTTTVGQADLYCGSLEATILQLGRTVDLTITSPPYNLKKDYQGDGGDSDDLSYDEYLTWSYTWLKMLWYQTSVGGRLCLNVPVDTSQRNGDHTIVLPLAHDVLQIALNLGWKYQTTIDWAEGNIGRRTAWGSYACPSAPFVTNPNERVFVLYKGDRWKSAPKGKTWDIEPEQFKAWTLGSWEIPGASARRIGHPAPFPEELVRRLILLFSYREDLVCDPFGGAGTTSLVANRLGRSSVYIDQVAGYVELATNRLEADGLVIDTAGNAFIAEPIPLPIQSELAEAS